MVIYPEDPNTKRFKRTLHYFDTDTQYTHFEENSPLSSYKTTLKTTDKPLKNDEKFDFKIFFVSCFGSGFVACSVIGRLNKH